MVTILLTRRCGRVYPGRIFLCLSPLFVSSNLTSWLQRPTKTPVSLSGWEHLFGICAGGFLAVGCQVTQWERRQQSQPSPSCERCADEQVAQLETEENTSLWGTPAYFTDCGFISRLTGQPGEVAAPERIWRQSSCFLKRQEITLSLTGVGKLLILKIRNLIHSPFSRH